MHIANSIRKIQANTPTMFKINGRTASYATKFSATEIIYWDAQKPFLFHKLNDLEKNQLLGSFFYRYGPISKTTDFHILIF